MTIVPGPPKEPELLCSEGRVCDHCGDRVSAQPVYGDEGGPEGKIFCCRGCKTVYALLRENDLCEYYSIAPRSGISPKSTQRFEFLDDDSIQQTLLDFRSSTVCSVTLSLPQMHCSSCIWLIEHLYRIDRGIIHSRADFLRRSVVIQYAPSETSLRSIVELLASLGYTPELHIGPQTHDRKGSGEERSLLYRIGIAGFCFGNIMLLSFPEYLSVGDVERSLRTLFSYASLLLAIPVVAYCASGYFLAAFRGLRKRTLTLDVPIALGIAVVFLRSLADIAAGSGPGFLDSLSGLVFFLLLGKLFQSKTYERLNFERNYRSYFPIAVTVVKDGAETTVPLENVGVGDKILVRNNEIIPADAYVLKGEASIDYSFVTGESALQPLEIGDLVYAGGRQSGSLIEVQIAREISQSYLTQLWNAGVYADKKRSRSEDIADAVGKYFTVGVLALAACAGAYWLSVDPSRALDAVTGVLIIACPCALALSIPFTMGTAMRIFGRSRCYVKNTAVIESLASVDTIVFDKTGTLTGSERASVRFAGEPLTAYESSLIASLAFQSAHPVSRIVASALRCTDHHPVAEFREEAGQGIEGIVDDRRIRLGTPDFVGAADEAGAPPSETRTYAAIGGCVKGYFAVKAGYRHGIGSMLEALGRSAELALVSGDNDSEREALAQIHGRFASMLFYQSPMDKLRFVQAVQAQGKRVAMIGDGLNDAGALKQSDAGIAVTEEAGGFSPACDAILEASRLGALPEFLSFARASVRVVHGAFAFSFLYNIIGLFFAIQGVLSPVMAAVLMPLSSISVVLFATLSTRYAARKRGL